MWRETKEIRKLVNESIDCELNHVKLSQRQHFSTKSQNQFNGCLLRSSFALFTVVSLCWLYSHAARKMISIPDSIVGHIVDFICGKRPRNHVCRAKTVQSVSLFFPVCLNIQAHRIKLLQKNFHSNWITFESNLEIFYFRNIFSSFHPPVLHSTSFLMNYLWVFCVTKAMRYTPNSTPLKTIDIFIFGRHIFLYLSVTFSLCKLHKKKRKKRKNGKRTSICRTQTKTNKKNPRERNQLIYHAKLSKSEYSNHIAVVFVPKRQQRQEEQNIRQSKRDSKSIFVLFRVELCEAYKIQICSAGVKSFYLLLLFLILVISVLWT